MVSGAALGFCLRLDMRCHLVSKTFRRLQQWYLATRNIAVFKNVFHLLSRPWFERLWVRQEVHLRRTKAVVLCGRERDWWTSFHKGVSLLHCHPTCAQRP